MVHALRRALDALRRLTRPPRQSNHRPNADWRYCKKYNQYAFMEFLGGMINARVLAFARNHAQRATGQRGEFHHFRCYGTGAS